MRLFITKKKLIKKLAEELAYLQIRADWWYYCFNDGKNPDKVIDNDTEITVRDMSSSELDLVTEVKIMVPKNLNEQEKELFEKLGQVSSFKVR